ncbi:hypothetical protein JCM19379_11370 [Methyloparacoccus murrellii]
MGTRTRPPKSLSDIKTHSGRVSRGDQSYRDYFQAGALELEKWRREREREASLRRLSVINDRIAQINHEKSILLGGVLAEDLRKSETGSSLVEKPPRGVRIKY